MTRSIITKILLCGLLATALFGATGAQAQTTMEARYTWTVPEGGSAVVHYVVQHRVDGGDWVQVGTSPTNTYVMSLAVGQSHEIRVAGVDAEDRMGPFSVPSDPYVPDPGAPAQPGKPILF